MKIWFFVFLLLGQRTYAAYSNYNSILVGDQSAGMGGAGAAVVGDTSGMAFYNPALLAMVEGSSFSAAVGIYKKFDTLYGQDEDIKKAPLRVNKGFFESIPSSTGNVLKIYDWYFGMSIVVPDFDQYKGDLRKTDTGTTTFSTSDQSLWVGGALARQLDNKNSYGVTLYYTARTASTSINDRSFTDASASPTNSKLFTSERTMTDNALLAVIGYYHEGENWAWGVSVRPPALKVSSAWNYSDTYTQFTNGATSSNVTNNEKESDGDVVIPARYSFGLTNRFSESLLLSMNVDAYQGIKYVDVPSSVAKNTIDFLPIVNLSVGAEKAIYPWLKARVGLYTNFSSHPDPSASLHVLQDDKVDMLGFSANVLIIANSKIGYTFGGYYTGGKGLSIQRMDQSLQVISKTQQVFTMLVGTSFFF